MGLYFSASQLIKLMKFVTLAFLAGLGLLGFAQEQPHGSLVIEEPANEMQNREVLTPEEEEIIDEIISFIPEDKPTREKVADVMHKIENKIRMKDSSDRQHAKSVMKAMKHLGAEHGKEAFTRPASCVKKQAAQRRERKQKQIHQEEQIENLNRNNV